MKPEVISALLILGSLALSLVSIIETNKYVLNE